MPPDLRPFRRSTPKQPPHPNPFHPYSLRSGLLSIPLFSHNEIRFVCCLDLVSTLNVMKHLGVVLHNTHSSEYSVSKWQTFTKIVHTPFAPSCIHYFVKVTQPTLWFCFVLFLKRRHFSGWSKRAIEGHFGPWSTMIETSDICPVPNCLGPNYLIKLSYDNHPPATQSVHLSVCHPLHIFLYILFHQYTPIPKMLT